MLRIKRLRNGLPLSIACLSTMIRHKTVMRAGLTSYISTQELLRTVRW